MFKGLLIGAFALGAAAPAGAAWHKASSTHFVIYSEQKPADLKRYAERLERFDQAVRVARGMKDPPLTSAGKLTVFVLRNADSVAAVVGARGSGIAGVYIPRASGATAIVHRERTSSKFDLSSESVFFHEYLHHLMLQDLNLALPSWVVEGFAEFFATARIQENGSVVLGHVPEHRSVGLFNLRGLTIEEMVGATDRHIDSDEWELTYGRGWLLTHYLTFEKSRQNQFGRYVAGIQKGEAPLAAARAAFGDLKQLNRELDAYLREKRHSGIVIPAQKLSIGAIDLAPVSAGADAIMSVRMRNAIGFKEKAAARTAADARKVAADYSADADVQAELARAELAVERHAEALAAADRALVANPNHRKAMTAKARALMEMGKKNPANADWKDIRSWLSKANRLDPDDAEPLQLFYESFAAEGVPATRNAVQGLMYAHSVMPQVSELRMLAVRQLIIDGNLEGARRTYEPIAYDPHGGKTRDDRVAVVARLKAKDGKGALALLDTLATKEKDD